MGYTSVNKKAGLSCIIPGPRSAAEIRVLGETEDYRVEAAGADEG